MKLATLRAEARPGSSTVAVRIDGDAAVEIDGFTDVGALLATEGWRDTAAAASGASHALADIEPQRWAPVVPKPGKIVCVGLNYGTHITEMGRELPVHPTLFAKFPEALIGPFDDVEMPAISNEVDWEAELAVIIGAPARRVTEGEATAHIAGYAVLNDVTMRDYQYRTLQWLQGKTFENTTPFGPYLVTTDEWQLGPDMRCIVDGDTVQDTTTADLVFTPEKLVSYISDIVTLNAGDVIATGTTGGVGHARKPARYLKDGSILETEIDGLGAQRNLAKSV
ncbi:acylpyruvate hydrolase [Homoserinimonas aerilata]|uniref:Acylpyruvate hydrolase n=1 Tax=Homoserinimonas aerilata TaxID=1162970 RepID=A0A542YG65_9MICO|nr:fumarylacetoacetate hydrolase family protein [Homoserinimonas aerilata]TQL46974.1 acylpyruvate hydrolase [Homoserinimonas aerilata]